MAEEILHAIEKINELRGGENPPWWVKPYKRGPVKRIKIEPQLFGNQISAQLRHHLFVHTVEFTPDRSGDYFSLKLRKPSSKNSGVMFLPALRGALESAGYEFESSEKDNWGLKRHDIYEKGRRVGVLVTKAKGKADVLENIDATTRHIKPLVQIIFGSKALPGMPKQLPAPKSK